MCTVAHAPTLWYYRLYAETGNTEAAEQTYKRCISILLSLGYPDNTPGVVDLSLALADIYAGDGRLDVW